MKWVYEVNEYQICLIKSVNSRIRNYLARLDGKQVLYIGQWNVCIQIGLFMNEVCYSKAKEIQKDIII